MYILLHAEWLKHLYIFKQLYEILFNSNTAMENVLLNFWSRVTVNVANKLQILPVLPISQTLWNNTYWSTNSLLNDMKYLMILVYSAWKRSKITHKIFESNFVSINEIKIYIYFDDFRVFCAIFPWQLLSKKIFCCALQYDFEAYIKQHALKPVWIFRKWVNQLLLAGLELKSFNP